MDVDLEPGTSSDWSLVRIDENNAGFLEAASLERLIFEC